MTRQGSQDGAGNSGGGGSCYHTLPEQENGRFVKTGSAICFSGSNWEGGKGGIKFVHFLGDYGDHTQSLLNQG